MKFVALAVALILALAGCAQFGQQFGQQAALSSGIAPGGGGPPAYKVIQVNVTGPSEASATALVSDY